MPSIVRTETVCEGPGSPLARLHSVAFLRPLLRDVEIAYPLMNSFAPCVRPVGTIDVIEIPANAHNLLTQRSELVCSRMALVDRRPWRSLGLQSRAFSSVHRFSTWVAETALDFVVLHELGHVVLGHLSLWPRRQGFCFREVPSKRPSGDSKSVARDRRALEVGADHAAAWFMHFLLPDLAAESRRYRAIGFDGSLAGMLFAGHFVFAYFAERESALVPTKTVNPFDPERHHPPSSGRIHLVENAILNQPSTSKARTRNRRAMTRAREAVGLAIACHAFPVDYFAPLVNTQARLLRYMNASVNRWHTLSKRCLPTSRWGEANAIADAHQSELERQGADEHKRKADKFGTSRTR